MPLRFPVLLQRTWAAWGRPVALPLLAAAAAGLPAQAQAPLDVRVALVIGNAAYAQAPLANPTNDARAMGDTLRSLGFTVVELRDGQRTQMAEAIGQVRASLQGKQGIGMLYYAGHGLQLDWQNYMVPVDAKLGSAADVPAQTVNVNQVIDAFKQAGNRMNILVLDACRDNPFAGTGSGKGLAQLDAPPGTFLAYATAPGNVAEDGDAGAAGNSGNGLYTRHLLEELKKPTAKIEDVFKRVRLQVRQKSQGRQIPWESTSLEDDFDFSSGRVLAAAKRSDAEKEKAFETERADWEKIKDSRNPDDYYAFLQKYPRGFISEQVQAVLERLQKAQTVAVANKEGVVQVAGSARYRLGDAWVTRMIDGYSNQEVRRGRSEVTKVDGNTVEINGGASVFTPEGAQIRFPGSPNTWNPPRLDLPSGDYVVGKKWTYRTMQHPPAGSPFWDEGEVKVVALEDVTVPMGTFKAYKLVMEGIQQTGSRVKLTRWMQPDSAVALKTIREIRPRNGPATWEIYEMVSRTRGPT